MAGIDDFNHLKDVVTKLNVERPARFGFTQAAVDAAPAAEVAALEGVFTPGNSSQINSIPAANLLAVDPLINDIGLRTQAASLPRMVVNHFLGRLSLNLLKLTEKVKFLIENHLVNRYITPSGNVLEDVTVTYAADVITLVKHSSPLDASAPITASAPVTLLAAISEGNAGVMTGADKKALDDVVGSGTSGAVLLSGVQTIAGIKSFSDIPLGPASDPVADDQFARKAYVDSQIIYDYVVDSQSKFNALIASGTWLGAKNVLFTVNVTRSAQTTIPATVEKIHAINGATLAVTGLTGGPYGIGYATRPTGTEFEIVGLKVTASGTGLVTGTGFSNCTNLTNCTGSSTGTGDGIADGTGTGFSNCTNLINCTGDGIADGTGYGFSNCTNLTNCTGSGTGTGTGTGDGDGYGFYGCSYAGFCRKGVTSTTATWGGTNSKIRACEDTADIP